MLKLSCKFGESNWNPCWLFILTSSSGTNYVLNEHDVDQYGSFAMPSKIKPYQNYPESVVNQNEIHIELLCKQAHLALIMSQNEHDVDQLPKPKIYSPWQTQHENIPNTHVSAYCR